MAVFMSDAELVAGMKEMADRGELVETGWRGFIAMVESALNESGGQPMSKEQIGALRWAFWTGARCVFDALDHLARLDPDQPLEARVATRMAYIKKLSNELGNDPFCRPPSWPDAKPKGPLQ